MHYEGLIRGKNGLKLHFQEWPCNGKHAPSPKRITELDRKTNWTLVVPCALMCLSVRRRGGADSAWWLHHVTGLPEGGNRRWHLADSLTLADLLGVDWLLWFWNYSLDEQEHFTTTTQKTCRNGSGWGGVSTRGGKGRGRLGFLRLIGWTTYRTLFNAKLKDVTWHRLETFDMKYVKSQLKVKHQLPPISVQWDSALCGDCWPPLFSCSASPHNSPFFQQLSCKTQAHWLQLARTDKSVKPGQQIASYITGSLGQNHSSAICLPVWQ